MENQWPMPQPTKADWTALVSSWKGIGSSHICGWLRNSWSSAAQMMLIWLVLRRQLGAIAIFCRILGDCFASSTFCCLHHLDQRGILISCFRNHCCGNWSSGFSILTLLFDNRCFPCWRYFICWCQISFSDSRSHMGFSWPHWLEFDLSIFLIAIFLLKLQLSSRFSLAAISFMITWLFRISIKLQLTVNLRLFLCLGAPPRHVSSELHVRARVYWACSFISRHNKLSLLAVNRKQPPTYLFSSIKHSV